MKRTESDRQRACAKRDYLSAVPKWSFSPRGRADDATPAVKTKIQLEAFVCMFDWGLSIECVLVVRAPSSL